MTPARARWLGSWLLVCVIGSPARAAAEPFRPGDVVRVTFDVHDSTFHFPFDAFEFALGLVQIESIGSYTTRLFDRGQLLGTYTGPGPGFQAGIIVSTFKESTSILTRGNPTVVDLSSFHDRTFDGALEFTIQSGRADIQRTSDELTLGIGVSPSVLFSFAIPETSFEISHEVAPVPEPGSLLLLASAAVGCAARGLRRRRSHYCSAERSTPARRGVSHPEDR